VIVLLLRTSGGTEMRHF